MSKNAVQAYKGFDQQLKCREFQYELGGEFTHEGRVEPCESGFHACEHPLSVFGYYPPALSRFCEVKLSGEIKASGDKIVSAKIKIGPELSLSELIARAVKYVIDRTIPEGSEKATGYQGAASATGYQGAASATGTRGAASATGKHSVALAAGWMSKAKASLGCALFLVERNDDDEIVHVFSGIAGQGVVNPDTWYTLSGGQLSEVDE